ncbi:SHOCT domain-containing protein [Pedococcus soli]
MKRVVPMMGGYDTGWGGWVVMSVMMVGLWVVVAVAIVAVMRWPWGARDRAMVAGTDNGSVQPVGREVSPVARALLEQRFAAGDIDEAEYRSRLAALMSRA